MTPGLSAALAGVERLGRPWMVGGSLAAMCYSEPRSTLDLDCVLGVRPGDESRFPTAFSENDFYLPPPSVIAHEIRRGSLGSFNLIHHGSGFKIDCYPCGDDALMRWALDQPRLLPLAGMTVPIAPPEYIVVMKLRYFAMSGQDKHLRDIRSIVRLLPDLDRTQVERWATRYGVGQAWELART